MAIVLSALFSTVAFSQSRVATPVFSLASGVYTTSQSVAISTTTTGATIRYTTNGNSPSASSGTIYTGSIPISQNVTIKAIAYKSEMSNSQIVSGEFAFQCATPTFSPEAGSYTGTQTITISTISPDASIHYTTDNSTPTASSGNNYNGPVTVSQNTTIKAVAYKNNWALSTLTSASFTIQCEAPGFNPEPGTYSGAQTITLSSATSGASIRYTTNGTNPTASSGTVYSAAIPVSSTTTIKAISYKSGMANSSVVSGTYTIQSNPVENPVLSPAGGTFATAQSVTITSATAGATIRYTTDGTVPSSSVGSIYGSAIAIPVNTAIKAIAYKSGMPDSGVVTEVYAIRCVEPAFSPIPGTYSTVQTVALTSATTGASIRYTTDGSAPTPGSGAEYTSAITVGATTTIKAISYKSDMANSIITSGTFTIQLLQVAAPVFTPAGGTFSSAQSVTIASATSDAIIRYTTDGSVPSSSSGTVYSAAIPVSTSTNFQAIAYKAGMNESGISTAAFILRCETPVFSPEAGSFERPQTVTISCATPGSAIRYTTDGTTPDASTGRIFSGVIQVNTSMTIKAIAYAAGFQNSHLAEGRFSLGSEDGDGDGVIDAEDEYPTDPARALTNFFPATGTGSLAFEDLWPSQGDYDLNDVVVDYSFRTVISGTNKLVETFATFVVRAAGASLKNGFGFQLAGNSIPASGITVTGTRLTQGYITLNPSGTEANQVKPTIIVFDNVFDILKNPGSGSGINTTPGAPFVDPVTIELHLVFTPNAYDAGLLDIEHFNPFIIINMVRNREVHLPDYAPTSLADQNALGTFDDSSVPSENRYYKTKGNLPWAFNIYESFDYPNEKAAILKTYLHFAEWAQSSGSKYPDWYKNLPGYRDESNVYKH